MNEDMDGPLTRLRVAVAEMRQLGVTKWGDIELGPAPPVAPPPERELNEAELENDRLRAVRERFNIALGSAGGEITDAWIEKWQQRGVTMAGRHS